MKGVDLIMKRFICSSLILSIMLILCISGFAFASRVGSTHLQSYSSSIVAEGNGIIQVYFEVEGMGKMTSLGVTQIEVQKKVGTAWVPDITLKSNNYPNFLASNTSTHSSSVRVTGVAGTQYRAIITFYAANSTGSDSKDHASPTATCY
jgi:hypothetical protein